MQCGKEKGIPVMDIFRYLFCMMFSDRSIYMQMKTGTFAVGFSKSTIYRFLNNSRTNWQRFTTLLSSSIISGFIKTLTDEKRKDIFIVDDSLFDSWFPAPKTILAPKKQEHPDTIAMTKKGKTKYLYNGEKLNVQEIHSWNRKCRNVPITFFLCL